MLTQREYAVIGLFKNLQNVFKESPDELEHYKYDKKLNEDYFTDLLRAFHLHFKTLVPTYEVDLIEFIGVLNKLAFQYLLGADENNAPDKEED